MAPENGTYLALPNDAFVFSHEPDGSVPWKPGYVSLKFRRLRASVGLDEVRLHDLRHFVATALLGAGVDLQTVAGRLDHAGGGRTTLAVYSHFHQAADRKAADLIGKLPAGTTGTPSWGGRPDGGTMTGLNAGRRQNCSPLAVRGLPIEPLRMTSGSKPSSA